MDIPIAERGNTPSPLAGRAGRSCSRQLVSNRALAKPLEGHHEFRRLLRMAAAADRHEHVVFGNTHFLEEHVVHFAIVMLAGMNDLERQPAMRLQGADDRGDFHEIRARCEGGFTWRREDLYDRGLG